MFQKEMFKMFKKGQNGNFRDIFQPLGPARPTRKLRDEASNSLG